MKKIKRISRIEIEEALDVNSKKPEPLYCGDNDVAVMEARMEELEERLRRTIDALEEVRTVLPVMRGLSLSAIIMDVKETLERKWISISGE